MRLKLLVQIQTYLLLLCTHSVFSHWDFAVTTESKIVFFDSSWQELTSSAHQFDELSAITLDEAEEVVYFNDRQHNNGSIFSLKIPTLEKNQHIIEKIVQRTQNERIEGIAYDPVDQNIYWTDKYNRKIYYASVVAEKSTPTVLLDLVNEKSVPDGLAIDVCRRKLYWTNSNFKNASVERMNLDGSERQRIVGSDLYLPHGIVVDQLSGRIYWVVDQEGIHFSVESANLDGADRQVLVRGLNNVPFNLAVTKDAIYWTGTAYKTIWSIPKGSSNVENQTAEHEGQKIEPQEVISFKEQPFGIVSRTNFLAAMMNHDNCSDVVHQIRNRVLTPKPTQNPVDKEIQNLRRQYCLNGGDYIAENDMCLCNMGYKGKRCEQSECHNYCVHGTCTMPAKGFPECFCQHGFYGARCQNNNCTQFCLNGGTCQIESNGDPTCKCKGNFGGQRCEHNSTEICSLFCRMLKYEPDVDVPFGCRDICGELAQLTEDGSEIYSIPHYKHLQVCHNPNNTTTIITVLVCGVVSCLLLVAILVHGLRRLYKPARPRIKKTFVVRKHAVSPSDTPLTNRPVATEQCEITIENCCNMNICETPCFDPQMVQQSFTREHRIKEDKKMLIPNLEEELY